MSLAQVWRRHLLGAASAALIVPVAMLAALVVLGLGGFRSLGVLGQIFAGPPAPSVSVLGAGHRETGPRAVATSLPVIPAAPAAARGGRVARGGGGGPAGPGGPGGLTSLTRTGGPTGSLGAPVSITRPGPGAVAPRPSAAPAAPPVGTPPHPAHAPTVVDQVVKIVTPVTAGLPAPAGPAVTAAVQSAGSAADGLIPPSGSPLP